MMRCVIAENAVGTYGTKYDPHGYIAQDFAAVASGKCRVEDDILLADENNESSRLVLFQQFDDATYRWNLGTAYLESVNDLTSKKEIKFSVPGDIGGFKPVVSGTFSVHHLTPFWMSLDFKDEGEGGETIQDKEEASNMRLRFLNSLCTQLRAIRRAPTNLMNRKPRARDRLFERIGEVHLFFLGKNYVSTAELNRHLGEITNKSGLFEVSTSRDIAVDLQGYCLHLKYTQEKWALVILKMPTEEVATDSVRSAVISSKPPPGLKFSDQIVRQILGETENNDGVGDSAVNVDPEMEEEEGVTVSEVNVYSRNFAEIPVNQENEEELIDRNPVFL